MKQSHSIDRILTRSDSENSFNKVKVLSSKKYINSGAKVPIKPVVGERVKTAAFNAYHSLA
jgi:hypothetical protein